MSDHAWIKSYPEGVRWDAALPLTPISQLLDDAVRRWPEHPAILFMGRTLTFRALGELTDRAAAGFQRLGVGPGVHVGLFLPNTPHFAIAFFGVLKAGGVVVNYSPLDAERVLAHKIEDSQTDIMVTLDSSALYLPMARLLGSSRLRTLVVGSLGDQAAEPEAVRAGLQASGLISPVADDAATVRFAALLDNDGDHRAHPIVDLRQAIAVLQYTGGTTGVPKGAMLTHANLTAACAQVMESTQGRQKVLFEGEERLLVLLPLFHIYSLTANLLLGVRLGALQVIHTRFDVEAAVADLIGQRITVFSGVPTMYTALAAHPRVQAGELRSLRYCGSGGAPLPLEVAERFYRLTGSRLNEGWGMTETSPTGTFTPVHGLRKPGSCGIPVPNARIRIADLDDPEREAAPGVAGELCISGPNVLLGYWRNPGATAQSMTADGFFRSGDVARMDEDGCVFIVDRTKDMLLCGGYNVYPRIIEEAIYEHPAVEEVCVIGVPDEYRGQSPKAFVKLRRGAPGCTLAEMQAFLSARIGKHEMIQALEIRAELPKTPVGKLSKRDLVLEEEQKAQR